MAEKRYCLDCKHWYINYWSSQCTLVLGHEDHPVGIRTIHGNPDILNAKNRCQYWERELTFTQKFIAFLNKFVAR
jgi:hypothetical protein